MLNIVYLGFLLTEICNETQADVFSIFHLARKKAKCVGAQVQSGTTPPLFFHSCALTYWKLMKGTERKTWVSLTY